MPNIDLSEIFMMEDEPKPNSIIREIEHKFKTYQVFFDEEIGEAKKYRDLINLLYIASENDSFNFFINSIGGSLSTCLAIVEAIKSTDATVNSIVVGESHSAASILVLNSHNIMVTKNANMLCHSAQYGTGGLTANVQKHADFSSKYINRIIDETYVGFLTPEEISDLKKGQEFWFDSDEISKRLETRLEYIKSQNPEDVVEVVDDVEDVLEVPVKRSRKKSI